MAITPASTGSLAQGDDASTSSPGLPAGVQNGDLLICISVARTLAGTLSSTWTTHYTLKLTNFDVLVSYQIAGPSTVAPVITPTGFTVGQRSASRVVAYRGVDQSSPFGTPAAAIQNAAGANVGPITAATATAYCGAALVYYVRNAFWDSVATLTGDGLTWQQVFSDGVASPTGGQLAFGLQSTSWTAGNPTLTNKTATITGGFADQVGAGQMLLLNSLTDIQFVGAGTPGWAEWTTPISPSLPAGIIGGDLLVCISEARTVGGTLTSTWNTNSSTDYTSFNQLISFTTALGNSLDTSPTITPVNMITPQTHGSVVLCFRGINAGTPFALFGTAGNFASAANIGPITAPSVSIPRGMVLVIGNKLAQWTSVGVLSGDSLTWSEAVDSFTILDNDQGLVIDYAVWHGGAPTITDKTFIVTGGVNNVSSGQMIIITADDPAVSSDADISFVATKPSRRRNNIRRYVDKSYGTLDADLDISLFFDYSRPFVKPAFPYRFRGIIQPCGYPGLDATIDISGDFSFARLPPVHRNKRFLPSIVPLSDLVQNQAGTNTSDFDLHLVVIPTRMFKLKLFKPQMPKINFSTDVAADLSSEQSYDAVMHPIRRKKHIRYFNLSKQATELDTHIVGNLNVTMDDFIAQFTISLSIVGNLIATMDPFVLSTFIETWMDIHPEDDIWTPLSF